MPEENEQMLGARIKLIRGEMTLIQFADFIGVSKSSLSLYEKDERKPDTDFITALYEKCGVEPLWLLTGQGTRGNELTSREAALLDNYRHIDDEGDKRIVERTAQMAVKAIKDETQSGKKKAG